MRKRPLIRNDKIVQESINQLLFSNEMGFQGPEQCLPGLDGLRMVPGVKANHAKQRMKMGEDDLKFGSDVIAQSTLLAAMRLQATGGRGLLSRSL